MKLHYRQQSWDAERPELSAVTYSIAYSSLCKRALVEVLAEYEIENSYCISYGEICPEIQARQITSDSNFLRAGVSKKTTALREYRRGWRR